MIPSISRKDADRLSASVKFTETYEERLKGLLRSSDPTNQARSNQSTRVLLLQDCWGGQDALAVELGRDSSVSGWMVDIVGVNSYSSINSFKLQLSGLLASNDPTSDVITTKILGLSKPIKQISDASAFFDALANVGLNIDNMAICFGNPFYSEDLIVYGNVAAASIDTNKIPVPPYSMLGMWLIMIDETSFPGYASLLLEPVLDQDTTMQGLTAVNVTQWFDLPGSDPTIVTDIYYRPKEFPWQAGTIATCIDFSDIGYGIIGNAPRNLSVVLPLS